MNLFSEFVSAVQSDLTTGAESSLFTPTVIKSAINRSYIKCASLFKWPETEDAKRTSSKENVEYYNYPANWVTDSIFKLKIGTQDYGDPMTFKDYQYEKENEIPSGRTYFWATYGRRYFIYPTPTADGSFDIYVWGQRVVDELVNDNDVTIFSYNMPECNEAIVKEAVALLRQKDGDNNTSMFVSNEAKQLLIIAWGKITQNQPKYQSTQPQFNIPDFFGRNNVKNKIGGF